MSHYLYLPAFNAEPEEVYGNHELKRALAGEDPMPGYAGFTKLKLRFSHHEDDGDEVIIDLMSTARKSGTGGSFQRVVILDDDYEQYPDHYSERTNYDFTLWIGNNVWRDKYSFMPGSSVNALDFMSSFKNLMEKADFEDVLIEVRDDSDDEDKERAETASLNLYEIAKLLENIGKGRESIDKIEEVIFRMNDVTQKLKAQSDKE